MGDDLSPIAVARLSSALTSEEAARATGMSKLTYAHVEEHPLQLTVGELRSLWHELNVDGQSSVREWLKSIFPTKSEI